MRFRVADAFLPEAEELDGFVRREELLEGTVIDISDSGSRLSYFAVVDVIKRYAVVVPVEKLEIVHANNSSPSVDDGSSIRKPLE